MKLAQQYKPFFPMDEWFLKDYRNKFQTFSIVSDTKLL